LSKKFPLVLGGVKAATETLACWNCAPPILAIEEKILILSESLKEEPERLETLCTKQGAVMKEVVLTPALTIVGVAVKLNLWRQTQLTYLDENDVLWDSLAEDLFLLSGVAVTKFYPETWAPNTL